MTSKSKRLLWTVGAAAALACLIFCLAALLRPDTPPVVPLPGSSSTASADTSGAPPQDVSDIPVDFESWQERYPDIYAWIQFPGTPVDYPIVRREGDDSYYLRRNLDGGYAIGGTLFTETAYNSDDFNDPVTIIYGHDMNDNTMFGSLQPHLASLTLDENAVFHVYQPGRQLTYRVFAAVPYDNSHVLYYNDFSNEFAYSRFFEKIFSTRSLHANLAPDAAPGYGDRVAILATCLKGDYSQRFLVMGVLTQDSADPVITDLP